MSAPGAPSPEDLERSLDFVARRLSTYYARVEPWLPPRYLRREFGFLWNGQDGFLRHTGISGAEGLQRFLVARAPSHCYYSTAYYDDPTKPTMKEKEWRGADVVFDMDADHLSEEAAKWPLARQLDVIKKEGRKLLDEFLLGDFGFAPEHVRPVFSGGRGYHFHVTDPKVWKLDGAGRRELVDYVTGNTLKPEEFVRDAGPVVLVPPADAPGWRGRYTRGALAMVEGLARQPTPADAMAEAKRLGLKGVGEKTAENLPALLVPDAQGVSQIERVRRTGRTAHPVLAKLLRQNALGVAGVNEEAGETDEPVTADVKRLIRLPGSIHGKTSLRCQVVPLDQFDAFDPLRDACPWGEEPVRVVVSKPEAVTLAGVAYACDAGEQTLPERYAMFLIARRRAVKAREA